MEKSMRIEPVPQPPLLASQLMMLLDEGLLGLAATGVFQGLAAWNKPVPPAGAPELDEDEEDDEDELEEDEEEEDDELDDEEEEPSPPSGHFHQGE
jgi:hypothetical protein